jgi:hypothetical protein
MKRDWSADELVAQWILLPTELALLGNKSGATRLGFAVLLKFFQGEGCFPRHSQEIPGAAVEYVARQIGVPAAEWVHYNWDSRGAKYHRTQIRDLLGFHEATVEDGEALVVWLDEHVLQQDRQMDRLKASVIERCRVLRIEPPTPDRIDRLIRSAVHRHEERFSKTVLARLSADTQAQLNDLVIPGEPLFEPVEQEAGRTLLQELRADPGRASLESVRTEIASWNGYAASGYHQICSRRCHPRCSKAISSGHRRKNRTNCVGIRRRSGPCCRPLTAISGLRDH